MLSVRDLLLACSLTTLATALPSVKTDEAASLFRRNNDNSSSNIEVIKPSPVLEPPFPVIPEINKTQPRFQVYDDEFYNVIGENPVLRKVASNPDYACSLRFVAMQR